MSQFRKKPVVIEAVQWDGGSFAGVARVLELCDRPDQVEFNKEDGTVRIPTLEGVMTANSGDWIIKGVAGELYPCKPDIFLATYEVV